jgi:ADP-heptose:LPS heptosyltransferase
VLRANAIGDFIFSLPALAALKAAYRDAELVLLARRWHAEFLEGRPSPIDRVVALPPIAGLSAPPDADEQPAVTQQTLDALRAERFDVGIQLHGGGKASNPFLARIGARVTVGMRAFDAAPLDRWVRYVYLQHEIMRYLEVVALVGAAPVTLEPEVCVTAQDLEESRSVVPDAVPFVVLHPGATDPRRRWSMERFARLGDRLVAAGLTVVLTGDASERMIVRHVLSAMDRPAIDATGRLSLGGLAGLLARARVVVGNDTGPLHLARAVGAPSVTIYWVANLVNGAPITRHRHRGIGAWQLDCPVCGVTNVAVRCPHDPSFVDAVTYEEVEEHVFDVLACTASEEEGERSAEWVSLERAR